MEVRRFYCDYIENSGTPEPGDTCGARAYWEVEYAATKTHACGQHLADVLTPWAKRGSTTVRWAEAMGTVPDVDSSDAATRRRVARDLSKDPTETV